MINTRVKIEGLDRAQRSLNNLGDKIENPEEKLFARLKAAGMEDIDQRFMTRGYGTWPALKPGTIKRKGHGFVLIDSGAMISSIKGYRRGARIFLKVAFGGRSRNPRVPLYHQEGKGRLPQRKIVAVTPQLRQRMRDTVVKWLRDMIRAYKTEM